MSRLLKSFLKKKSRVGIEILSCQVYKGTEDER